MVLLGHGRTITRCSLIGETWVLGVSCWWEDRLQTLLYIFLFVKQIKMCPWGDIFFYCGLPPWWNSSSESQKQLARWLHWNSKTVSQNKPFCPRARPSSHAFSCSDKKLRLQWVCATLGCFSFITNLRTLRHSCCFCCQQLTTSEEHCLAMWVRAEKYNGRRFCHCADGTYKCKWRVSVVPCADAMAMSVRADTPVCMARCVGLLLHSSAECYVLNSSLISRCIL